jgi:hypothetical protein
MNLDALETCHNARWTSCYTFRFRQLYILWHVGPLLGNDRESISYATAVTE